MEQEYSTSTGYKIFYGIVGLVMVVLGIFLLTSPNTQTGPAPFFAIALLAIAIAIFVNLYKRKVIASADRIAYISIWGSSELATDDIKGFRTGDKIISIVPLTDGHRKITIRDYATIESNKDLLSWLGTNFKDLDLADYEAEEKEIIHDAAIGQTEEARAAFLKKIRQYVIAYTMGAYGLFFISVIFHQTTPLLGVASLIYPLAGMVLIGFGKGLIRLNIKKGSAYPSIFIGLFSSCIALIPQALMDKSVLNYTNVWTPVIAVFIVIAFILYFLLVKKAGASLSSQIVFIVMIAAAYGFGGTVTANAAFDQSNTQIFSSTVTNKYITHGKSTSYHITVEGWDQHPASESTTVSGSFYDQTSIGSKVHVNLKKGFLNIPWYYISL